MKEYFSEIAVDQSSAGTIDIAPFKPGRAGSKPYVKLIGIDPYIKSNKGLEPYSDALMKLADSIELNGIEEHLDDTGRPEIRKIKTEYIDEALTKVLQDVVSSNFDVHIQGLTDEDIMLISSKDIEFKIISIKATGGKLSSMTLKYLLKKAE